MKQINPQDILFAVKIKRLIMNEPESRTDSRADSMTLMEKLNHINAEITQRRMKNLYKLDYYRYQILELHENPKINPDITPQTLALTKKFLEDEIHAKQNLWGYKIAVPASGFQINKSHVSEIPSASSPADIDVVFQRLVKGMVSGLGCWVIQKTP